jgi:hypothetical protein
MEIQITPNTLKFVQESDQVLKGAPQPIDRPCCNHIKLTSGGGFDHRIKLFPMLSTLSTTNPVVIVLGDNLPLTMLRNALQLKALVLCCLAICRDAEVYGYTFAHEPTIAKECYKNKYNWNI